MPLYDCGSPDCFECQRAFGPDRSKAIAKFKQREAYYAELAHTGQVGESLALVKQTVKRFEDEAERDTAAAIAQGRMIGGLLDSIFGLPKKP